MTYRQLSLVGAGTMFVLFLTLLFIPVVIFSLFSVEQTASAMFLSHRAAVLFLGLSLLVYFLRDVSNLKVRKAVCLSIAVMMLAMAGLGILEFFLGNSGSGIFTAIVAELVLGLLYACKYRSYRWEDQFWGV